jgi:hypothetical protein
VSNGTGLSPKLQSLLGLARAVAKQPRTLTAAEVARAVDAGASDADTRLTVLLAAGFRAKTPPSPDAYRARAVEIAKHGYSDASVVSVPR